MFFNYVFECVEVITLSCKICNAEFDHTPLAKGGRPPIICGDEHCKNELQAESRRNRKGTKPTTNRAPSEASDAPTEFNTFGSRFPRGRRDDSGDESWGRGDR